VENDDVATEEGLELVAAEGKVGVGNCAAVAEGGVGEGGG